MIEIFLAFLSFLIFEIALLVISIAAVGLVRPSTKECDDDIGIGLVTFLVINMIMLFTLIVLIIGACNK